MSFFLSDIMMMIMMMIFGWIKDVICIRYKVLFRTDQAIDRDANRQTVIITNLKVLKYFETKLYNTFYVRSPVCFLK